MRRHQYVILTFALALFALTWLGVYFLRKTNNEAVVPEPTQALTEHKTVLIFLSSSAKDPEILDCEKTYPVERAIARLSDNSKSALGEYAYLALSELLKGPAGYEKDGGYFTSINDGVKVQSIVIENKIAQVDFNAKLNENIAGSCKVLAIRSQITETLKQFPGIDEVVISVNGDSKEILQP